MDVCAADVGGPGIDQGRPLPHGRAVGPDTHYGYFDDVSRTGIQTGRLHVETGEHPLVSGWPGQRGIG